MMKRIKNCIYSGLLVVTLTFGTYLSATAATLGLTTQIPSIETSFAFIDFFESGSEGILTSFGGEVDSFNGVTSTGFTNLSFGVGFSLADPTTGTAGGFDVFDGAGLFLGGDLAAVGFTEDVIEFQFNNLVGSAAGSFGTSVLALINFDDALGLNPFSGFIDGSFYTTSVSISSVLPVVSAAVPEPTMLSIFLLALLLMSLTRRI